MRIKQKSVRVVEIITDDFDRLNAFVQKRHHFLKKFLLIVKTNNNQIREFFEKSDFEVRFVKMDFDGSNEKIEFKSDKIEENSTKTEIYDKIIRSGVEIISQNRLIFLQKINAGAEIYSSKEIEIFAEVFGSVKCDGDYMIVKKAKEGSIIFHNTPLKEIKVLSFISQKGIKEL